MDSRSAAVALWLLLASACLPSGARALEIPDAALVDQDGRPVRFYSDLVRDRTVVVSFLFTSCEAVCPMAAANLGRLQALLVRAGTPRVRMISVSTDPASDTPERLAAFATRIGAQPNWTFVTGSQANIDTIAVALTGNVIRKGAHAPVLVIGNDRSGKWMRSYALDAAADLLARITALQEPPAATSAEMGEWSPPLPWGIVAVHMTLLPTGKVLLWPRYNPVDDAIAIGPEGGRTPHARVWDPATGEFTALPNLTTNLFCAGHALLPDGSVLVSGGHDRNAGGNGDRGVKDTSLLLHDAPNGRWVRTEDMKYDRWYATMVVLPGGDALAIGGSYGGSHAADRLNQPLEVWRRSWTGFTQRVGSARNLALQVDAVRMHDGHVEVFMVGRDGQMWRSAQKPDGSFPDDFALAPVGSAANLARRISVVTLADGRADVYMVGTDGRMWHSVQRADGTFADFAARPVGSDKNIARDIAAVKMPDGHVEVIMAGRDDGRLWRSSQRSDGTFPDFAARPVGSAMNRATRISALVRSDGRLDIYMIGIDGKLWHSAQQADGSFPDFAAAPVRPRSADAVELDVARLPDGRVDLFTVSADGTLWRTTQKSDASFPDFAAYAFAGLLERAATIAVAPFTDGRSDVYIARQDQTIWRSSEQAQRTWQELTEIAQANTNTGWFLYYPWAFLAPNGKVFVAGPTERTFWIDTAGRGQILPGPPSSVLRDYGAAVMYEPGRVLILGGGAETASPPVAHTSAEIIDLNDETPSWTRIRSGSMHFPRKQANATLLADGQVLVVGGTTHGGSEPGRAYEENGRAVLPAEIWNPVTKAFTQVASMAEPRTYHSTALLLPTGEVLVAGGGQGGFPAIDPHPTAQIYSPPYLFRGPRPTIASAPSSIAHGVAFSVTSSDAAGIERVTLVRLGSTTHAFDQNQRFATLALLARSPDTVTVAVPSNPNLLPPGHYLLFVLNGSGVPSIGRVVRVSARP